MATEELINQVNLLNTYAKALENQQKTLQTENEKLHREIYDLVRNQELLLGDVDAKKAKNQEIFQNILQLNEEVYRLNEALKVYQLRQKELLGERSSKENAWVIIKQQEGKIFQLQQKLKNLESESDKKTQTLIQKIQDLEHENAELIVKHGDSKDRRIAELTQELYKKEEQLSKKTEETQKQIKKFEQEKKCLSKNINQLDQRYTQTLKITQNSQNTIKSLQSDSNQLKGQLAKEQGLLEQYKTAKTQLLSTIQVNKITIKQLEDKLNQQNSSRSQDIQRLFKRLDEEQNARKIIVQEKEALQKKYHLMQNQASNRESQFTKEIDEKNQFIQQIQHKYDQIRLKIQEQDKQRSKLKIIHQDQIKLLKNTIAQLQKQMSKQKETFALQLAQYSQKHSTIDSLQRQLDELRTKGKQQRQQYKRKEELFKQKIKGLQEELRSVEKQVNSSKLTSIIQSQSRGQKESELNSLKSIIREQQKLIAEQKATLENLTRLMASKEKEIENLETNNSMLRKQIVVALANQDSSRKQVLFHKQKSTTLNRSSRASEPNLLDAKRNSYKKTSKRFTVSAKSTAFEGGSRSSALSKLNYLSDKNTSQSLVEEIVLPAQESDCEGV